MLHKHYAAKTERKNAGIVRESQINCLESCLLIKCLKLNFLHLEKDKKVTWQSKQV